MSLIILFSVSIKSSQSSLNSVRLGFLFEARKECHRVSRVRNFKSPEPTREQEAAGVLSDLLTYVVDEFAPRPLNTEIDERALKNAALHSPDLSVVIIVRLRALFCLYCVCGLIVTLAWLACLAIFRPCLNLIDQRVQLDAGHHFSSYRVPPSYQFLTL